MTDPRDICQSPPEAAVLLFDVIPSGMRVWEPACGDGLLVKGLRGLGYKVIGTDIVRGHHRDFLHWQPEPADWDCIVTNPPFTLKQQFVERCIQLGKPWALLLPFAVFGSKRFNTATRDLQLNCYFPIKRIAYRMPYRGWKGSPTQATLWVTSGFGRSPGRIRLNLDFDWYQVDRRLR